MPASPKTSSALGLNSVFSEAGVWETVGQGWRPLQSDRQALGYSVEWHDFTPAGDFDWAPSFHPRGVEICLNLAGQGAVQAGARRLELSPLTAGFYCQSGSQLEAQRVGGERHHFLTIEFSFDFLSRQLSPAEKGLHPALKRFLSGKPTTEVSEPIRLSHAQQELASTLSRPPVAAPAQKIWYQGKALEIASALLFEPEATEEFFCQRHKCQNHERVDRVIALLKENLSNPLSLEDIGRRVGCSHFYLSRIFSQEMGHGIFQHLRALRMDRAAELLRAGEMNVTQVAMEIGYSSSSHFSTAFHETFGCCPGLYPLNTLAPEVIERLKKRVPQRADRK